jgi:hypothetical protein
MNSLDTNYPVRYLEEDFWVRLIKVDFWKEGSSGKMEGLENLRDKIKTDKNQTSKQ